ncbi:hypothetical protein EJB05_36178, partial [Eragrostis curvula]
RQSEAMDAVAGVRTLSAREEELLGLLAGFPDDGEGGSDRELSFSDLVDAGFRETSAQRHATAAARDDQGSVLSPGKQEAAAASKQQQAAAREKRQRRQRSGGSRGSCGGGGDGVLLNFYVPGLLTRSMTAPRPGRGVGQGAPPAKAAVAVAAGPGKARTRAPLGIGCWSALWGRSRDHRSTPKVCS